MSGDIEGAMTYDRQNNKWIFAFEATGADLNISIDGDAFQYDVLTQCDDALAVANTIGFSGSSSNLEFGQNKHSFPVSVSQAG